MKRLCVISARGGSEGVAGKNIKLLLGKPLITWSIEQALSVPEISRVVVSTDSEQIAEIARDSGAEVPFFRPQHLASSTSGKFPVFKHALTACESYYGEKYDAYIDLDCTSPLRDISDIQKCILQYEDLRNSGIDGVFTVCPARKNPYFNLVEKDKFGNLKISKELSSPILSRQTAPEVLEHVASIYVFNPNYLHRANNLLDGNLRGFDIGNEKSFDIDSDFDFVLIEYLMKRKYGLL